MNAIQQISLKLQMGISPEVDIQPQKLRAMWLELNNEARKQEAVHRVGALKPGRLAHPDIGRVS